MSELSVWYCSIHTQFAWLHRINDNNNNNFHCLVLFYIFTIREAIDCLVSDFDKQYYTASLDNVHRSVSQSESL